MSSRPLTVNEGARLAAVQALAWPDVGADRGLADIVALAAELFSARVAVVSLVEREQVSALAAHGSSRRSVPREISLCAQAVLDDANLIVRDATKDIRFSGHPFVVGGPQLRFYAGALVRSEEGLPIGALCVMDTEAHNEFSAAQQQTLERLARMVEARLHSRALRARVAVANQARAAAEARVKDVMQEAIGAFVACDRLALNLDGRVRAALSRVERELNGTNVKAIAELASLRDLLSDLGAAARLDRAGVSTPELFEPSALLWTVVSDLTLYASQRGVEFDLSDASSGVEMLGDSWRFEELLEGVFSDCIDAVYGALRVDCRFETGGHAHLVLRISGEAAGPAPWRLSARSRELIDAMAGCWELSRDQRSITVLVPARLRMPTRRQGKPRETWGNNVLPFDKSRRGS